MAKSFQTENVAFEDWLRKQCCVVEADLKRKYKRMRENAFVFLRSTFFRWASIIEAICPDLKAAPRVLSIGDTHLENFGTWRDVEGRLVWGVNDFDEAAVTPYPFDLVRLATSARLAPGIPLRNREVASAIFEGYASGLATPRPILLDEQETWMRPYVACSDDDRSNFWKEVKGYPNCRPTEGGRRWACAEPTGWGFNLAVCQSQQGRRQSGKAALCSDSRLARGAHRARG